MSLEQDAAMEILTRALAIGKRWEASAVAFAMNHVEEDDPQSFLDAAREFCVAATSYRQGLEATILRLKGQLL